MPSIRLTLINNSDQTQSSVILLDTSASTTTPLDRLLTLSQNKLRLKKASIIYSSFGHPLSDPPILKNGDELFISCGEAFVGNISAVPNEVEAAVRVLARLSPIEPEALAQLERTSKLDGMWKTVGMPDLHQGQSNPIGAVFISKDRVYPQLIGGDIGCGMALYSTSISASTSPTSLDKKLRGIEGSYEGSTLDWLEERGVSRTDFDKSAGTIGGGNHFAELQQIVDVLDSESFENLGIERNRLLLLVHSGSRGLGQDILRRTTSSSLLHPSEELSTYLKLHNNACKWALANRELIAHRVLTSLNASAKKILDIWHNNVERTSLHNQDAWFHRKGAAPSDKGLVIIPGSRGTKSYLVLPIGDHNDTGRSLAHGAGRVWDRKKAREKGEKRYGKDGSQRLRTTELGSCVVCEDNDLLFEEVPEAYKDVDAVVQDLVDLRLIRVVAILHPVLTYKTRTE